MGIHHKLFCAAYFSGVLAATPLLASANVIPDAVPIDNITTPRAFRGELQGVPERYEFRLTAQTPVYFSLLIPDINGARKDFLVEIISERGARYAMDGGYFLPWAPFRDADGAAYLKGPEIAPTLYPGAYTVRVSNTDNHGVYVLAIGNWRGFSGVPRSAANALLFAQMKPFAIAGSAATLSAVLIWLIRRKWRNVTKKHA